MNLITLSILAFTVTQAPESKWEKEIAAIEKRLKESPPKEGATFFVGSSSIRLWKLDQSFPKQEYINAGFGGSIVKDSTEFAPRIVIPFKPSKIVFYAGDNDIAQKRTPEQVRDDFTAFAKLIHEKLPKTTIYFLGIKPSPKRWEMYDQQTKANNYVKAMGEKDKRIVYLDTVSILLKPDGKPDPEFYVKDELHLSEKGYVKWKELVEKGVK